MTTTTARALSFRLHERYPADEHANREYVVELACTLRSDYDDETGAIAVWRAMRPDLCVTEIGEQIDHLLDLSEAVTEAEALHYGHEAFRAALDEYRDALWQFANPRRPDDMTALVDAVQGPAFTMAALDELAARRSQ